jgi:hypothetical protein
MVVIFLWASKWLCSSTPRLLPAEEGRVSISPISVRVYLHMAEEKIARELVGRGVEVQRQSAQRQVWGVFKGKGRVTEGR